MCYFHTIPNQFPNQQCKQALFRHTQQIRHLRLSLFGLPLHLACLLRQYFFIRKKIMAPSYLATKLLFCKIALRILCVCFVLRSIHLGIMFFKTFDFFFTFQVVK